MWTDNQNKGLTDTNIEGLIFKTESGKWVAFFDTGVKTIRVQVDYNPWTGEKLDTTSKEQP